jgi:hypothetical protein
MSRSSCCTAPDIRLVARGSPGCDEERQIWDGVIERRLAPVVRCGDPSAVAACVRHGCDEDLEDVHAHHHDIDPTINPGG